jgi:hypothetical protein
VTVRVEHVEIALTPRRIARALWHKSELAEPFPNRVHVLDVENQAAPICSRGAVLEVEYGRLGVSPSERRELGALPAVEQLHAERVAVEPHRYLHARHPKRHRRNLLNHGRTTRMIPQLKLRFSSKQIAFETEKLRNVSRVKESEGAWSDYVGAYSNRRRQRTALAFSSGSFLYNHHRHRDLGISHPPHQRKRRLRPGSISALTPTASRMPPPATAWQCDKP